MRGLDDVDREILDILSENARTPYSDIADAVDRAPPTVSDRIDRLRDLGVIRRFTVDLDRSKLDAGTPVLVELAVAPESVDDVREALRAAEAVERVYVTAGDRVLAHAHVPGDVRGFLDRVLPDEGVRSRDVSLLSDAASASGVGDVSLALSCAECGNTVTAEGESRDIDGDTYYFCCSSCEARFVERYESFADATNA
ncbi:winged helix-turn-helix transcriptional regulator [Salarchaeum japonicum]|uniref:winged helix-turn-helix transcriptional regulator n=1 Tax=Salarchaeum japonicum TaxID=555573 RepID=UPI003C727ED4